MLRLREGVSSVRPARVDAAVRGHGWQSGQYRLPVVVLVRMIVPQRGHQSTLIAGTQSSSSYDHMGWASRPWAAAVSMPVKSQ